MPLFACYQCGYLDNTALACTPYALARPFLLPPLCTVCDGRPWHDEFPRIEWDYATHGLPRAGVLQKRDEPAVPRCRALVLWVLPRGVILLLNDREPIVRALMHAVRDHYLPRP